ncbi:MAG TPA: hypothetical protein VFS21_04125 [Roseiflexaceae bacterium]|nr:hypothetical protein [Roseiflexaceae bacterium]
MRFIHNLTKRPVEERYTEVLEMADTYCLPELVPDAQMMVDLIRYLEAHDIGANTSVGTCRNNLTFREIAEFSNTEVWVSAGNGRYKVIYPRPGPKAEPWEDAAIEGSTPDIATVAEMLQGALRHAFAPCTEQQLRIMRREWALTGTRTPQPRPVPSAGPRTPLRRISQQPEPLEASFQRIADTGNRQLASKAQAMLALIPLLERNRRYRRFWVYTDQADLLFTNADGPQAGIAVAIDSPYYTLNYALPADAAPFPGARLSTSTLHAEAVDGLLEEGIRWLFR